MIWSYDAGALDRDWEDFVAARGRLLLAVGVPVVLPAALRGFVAVFRAAAAGESPWPCT